MDILFRVKEEEDPGQETAEGQKEFSITWPSGRTFKSLVDQLPPKPSTDKDAFSPVMAVMIGGSLIGLNEEIPDDLPQTCPVELVRLSDMEGYRIYVRTLIFLYTVCAKRVAGASRSVHILHSINGSLYTEIRKGQEPVVMTMDQILKIREAGIPNILALRGDIPEGMDFPSPRYFEHAIQLVEEIRRDYPDACIGGACYPEKHPDAFNKDEDIRHIKEKADAGCDFLTTQMFFNNSIYYNYLYRLREAGVKVPILAGIMPVTSRRQMERSIQLSGCVIPPELTALADRFGDSPAAMQQAGILYASHQIIDLIANGCGHIHVYTMNKPEVAAGILNNLKGIL